MKYIFSIVRNGVPIGKETYDFVPITKENYEERVKDMSSLAPEWKTLEKAPGSVVMLFEPDILLNQEPLFPGFPEDIRETELKEALSKEERSFLNAGAFRARPSMAEKRAENMIAQAWWSSRIPLHLDGRKYIQDVEAKMGYQFRDEYLPVQAFTLEPYEEGSPDVWGCDGVREDQGILAYFGESVLQMVISRVMSLQYCYFGYDEEATYGGMFICESERENLEEVRLRFSRESYLAERMKKLGFEPYLRQKEQGKEVPEKLLSRTIMALIGAVAIDCQWNMEVLEEVVGEILELDLPDIILDSGVDHYELLEEWAMKRFGRGPEAKIHRLPQKAPSGLSLYQCYLSVPNPGVTAIELEAPENSFKRGDGFSLMKRLFPGEKEHLKISEEKIACDAQGTTRGNAKQMAASLLWKALVSLDAWEKVP